MIAPIGILSFASNPLMGAVLLVVASLSAAVFGRALVADRQWREDERTTIRRLTAVRGGRVPYLNSVEGAETPGDPIVRALGSFLDDPDVLGSVVFEGPGAFHLRFTLLPTDSNVLHGEAVAFSRLDPKHPPGPDARLGLVALGWAAPTPPSREDFAAEWTLPVDVVALGTFILSTATIYGIDPTRLRPRFAAPRPMSEVPTSGGVPSVDARAAWDPISAFRRLSRRPAAQFASFVISLGILAAGRERFGEFLDSLPHLVRSGAIAIFFLAIAVHLLNRYRGTADPFSLTGWNSWRQRIYTTYAAHRWWGIFGATTGLLGIFFVIEALTGSGP